MRAFRNPALTLAWGLPALAIIASFASLALALMSPDGELPEQYHWEGFRLDRDFDEARRAADLNIRATLSRTAPDGMCRLTLRSNEAPPEKLILTLTHSTHPALDRQLIFHRLAGSAVYRTPCPEIADSHWRVSLTEAAGRWSVRQSMSGSMDAWILSARDH